MKAGEELERQSLNKQENGYPSCTVNSHPMHSNSNTKKTRTVLMAYTKIKE